MLELLERGGLGRLAVVHRGDREIRTPSVLFIHRAERPAPGFAQTLLTSERIEDPRLQFRVSGSFYASRAVESPDDLPPTKGLPISARDLESRAPTVSGDLAVITARDDLAAASNAEILFLANGIEYLRRPRDFAADLVHVRETAGPAKAVAVTGLAVPSNLAVLVYAGVDLTDSSRLILDSAGGLFHNADGVWPATDVDRDSCGCADCTGDGDLLGHNERALHREMLIVRNHLAHGRLRDLVERRLANDPWNTQVLRHLDLRHGDVLEAYTPVIGSPLLAYSHASLTRPEVLRFRRRVRERYMKPPSARVCLLLPCSARKPYSRSRSHRRFRDAVVACARPSVVHEVVVTSPLGLVPRELERVFPAGAYDIPVTGDWSRDEAAVVTDDLRAYLKANRYDAVVAHLGAEGAIVRAAFPEAVIPSDDARPTSDEALGALTATLDEMTGSFDRVPPGQRFAEEMTNLARFQFGPPGSDLVAGATFRGRLPHVRVLRGTVQVATHTVRGLLSLTLEGGRILSKVDATCVEIEDFVPKGNVFAVGVTGASASIRIGDEVVVRHRSEVRAVGSATMNGREMIDCRRGEAVHVRHALPEKS